MKNMCNGRLIEGIVPLSGGYQDPCDHDWECRIGRTCLDNRGGIYINSPNIKYCN
jgi:hypothetical protein